MEPCGGRRVRAEGSASLWLRGSGCSFYPLLAVGRVCRGGRRRQLLSSSAWRGLQIFIFNLPNIDPTQKHTL